MSSIEKRWLGDYKTPNIEVRGDDGAKKIFGHGAVFNRNSQNLGGFVEQVAPGAFTKTIQEADVRALINHDSNLLLGRNKANTLTLVEDNTGLAYEIDPPDTTAARDWMISMARGDLSQSSFSFRTIEVEWGLTADEFPLRTLREVVLYDVSPVTFPAYLDADSGVRSHVAFADLAEKRSVNLETVIDLAQHNELRDLIKDGVKPAPEPAVVEPPAEREHITIISRSEPVVQTVESREAAEELHESRDIDPVPGSYEAISDGLEDAIEDWAKDQYGATWVYVSIDATFPDSVVATIYCSAVEWEGVTFQFPYTVDADDKATLGEPEQVQLTLSITPADPERSDPVEIREAFTALHPKGTPRTIKASTKSLTLSGAGQHPPQSVI